METISFLIMFAGFSTIICGLVYVGFGSSTWTGRWEARRTSRPSSLTYGPSPNTAEISAYFK